MGPVKRDVISRPDHFVAPCGNGIHRIFGVLAIWRSRHHPESDWLCQRQHFTHVCESLSLRRSRFKLWTWNSVPARNVKHES